jgi:hypothetical protein
VNEWEDQLAEAMGLTVVDSAPARRRHDNAAVKYASKVPVVFAMMKALDARSANGDRTLYFALSPQGRGTFATKAEVVPMIIDFWKDLDRAWFHDAYGNCPLVLISSLEVFSALKAEGCPLNLRHFPLSLPDRYRLAPDQRFEKKHDVVIAGRPSPVLMEYMRRYEQDHPEVEYLYQGPPDDKGHHTYMSNKAGRIYGYNDRSAYFELLRASRVSFYSTPGIDGGEKRTGGFNPVTPRFLEILASGCHVMARYADNDDTRFYELPAICPSVGSYEEFEERLQVALKTEAPIADYSAYLDRHYTSNRIALLQQILSNPS